MDRTPQFASIKIPGAGNSTLRNINRIWNIHDAGLAVPFKLHPHGEHSANKWSNQFQVRLERVVKLTTRDERDQVMQVMSEVVYYRHQGKESRLLCVTVGDLETLYRRIVRKKIRERNMEARSGSQETSSTQPSQDAGQLRYPFYIRHGWDDTYDQYQHSIRTSKEPRTFL